MAQGWVPGDLRIVMRVQVDDARHQSEPAGIDDLGRILADLSNPGDAAVPDCHIGAYRVVPKPIDYTGAADHEVMHCYLSLVFYRRHMICIATIGRVK
jgi:hypothetical protein